MAYIRSETSLVLFDRKILITCGTNEQVVHIAAIIPRRVVQSNFTINLLWPPATPSSSWYKRVISGSVASSKACLQLL